MSSKFLALFIALIILSNTFISCKKIVESVHDSEQAPRKNSKKSKNAKGTGKEMPSFKEFIFSSDRIDYQKPVKWEDNGKKRTLLKYLNAGTGKLHKYVLVEESDAESWSSMYFISTNEIEQPGKLVDFPMEKEAVVNYDKYISGDNNYVINGVQINKVNYRLEDPLTSSSDKVLAECGKEYCIDSWLITYGEETGTVYFTEYDPICGVVNCGGGGGNPAIPASLPTMEAGQNILDQSVGIETHILDAADAWTETRLGIIRIAKTINWKFYDMHVIGGSHVIHSATFNSVLYAEDNVPPGNRVWKWETFVYAGNSQSTMYALGGYPPCFNATMNINSACAISPDQLQTDVDLAYNLKITISCLGGVVFRDFNGSNHATFLAATYKPLHT